MGAAGCGHLGGPAASADVTVAPDPNAGPEPRLGLMPTRTPQVLEPVASRSVAAGGSSKETPAATSTPLPQLPTVVATPTASERDVSPEVAKGDVGLLVEGNTAFALDLYHELARTDANLAYSPYSISLALALAFAGAGGATEKEMSATLRFGLPQGRLHHAFKALDLALIAPATTEDGDGFEMNIVNSVWGQQGHRFLPDYLDTLALNYGGNIRHADFRRSPGDAADQINGWASDETQDRIDSLISPQAIDAFTRLVLVNGAYFKAEWRQSFHEGITSRQPFFGLDGTESRVEMMRQTAKLDHARGDGFQAVELSYKGGRMSMVVLVPDENGFDEFEDSLDADLIKRVLQDMQTRRVRLAMPKFELEADFELSDVLAEMGMLNAFDDEKAEFQRMNQLSCLAGDDQCLWISNVSHKAFVGVDETGTEAAATTAVISAATSALPEAPLELTIDRPFVFLIRDRETRTVLFLGRVVEL